MSGIGGQRQRDAQGLRGHSRDARRGYTLVEMIIAMVLVSALMSSVWTIMSLYNGLLTAGRDRTTEQQLVRSLFQLINEDIAGINAVASEPLMMEFGETTDSLLPFSTENQAIGEATLFEELPETTVGDLSLTGTSTAIRLQIRRFEPPDFGPPSDIDLLNELGGGTAAQQETAGPVTEFQTIVYQVINQDSAGDVNSAGTSLSPGLYRIQVDTESLALLEASRSSAEQQRQVDSTELSRQNLTLLMQTADESSADESSRDAIAEPSLDSTPAPEAQVDQIPEVIGCRFEYFDGDSWLTSWSKDQLQALPAAVRISFDVVSLEDLIEQKSLESQGAPVDVATELSDQSIEQFSTLNARRYARMILLDNAPGDSQ